MTKCYNAIFPQAILTMGVLLSLSSMIHLVNWFVQTVSKRFTDSLSPCTKPHVS